MSTRVALRHLLPCVSLDCTPTALRRACHLNIRKDYRESEEQRNGLQQSESCKVRHAHLSRCLSAHSECLDSVHSSAVENPPDRQEGCLGRARRSLLDLCSEAHSSSHCSKAPPLRSVDLGNLRHRINLHRERLCLALQHKIQVQAQACLGPPLRTRERQEQTCSARRSRASSNNSRRKGRPCLEAERSASPNSNSNSSRRQVSLANRQPSNLLAACSDSSSSNNSSLQ